MFKFVKNFLKKLNKTTNATKDFETYSKSNSTSNVEFILKKDNEIKKITPDFIERMEVVKEKIIEKFKKKPNVNSIYWNVLSDLYHENFMINHAILLNIEYQRGLIRIKEKAYLDAISFLTDSLIYLKLIYPELDYLDTIDKKSIAYKSRARIIRKIKRCINLGYVTNEDFFNAFQKIISNQYLGIDRDELLQELYLELDEYFFLKDFAHTIDFNSLESVRFHQYTDKFKRAIQYFLNTNDVDGLKIVLHKYYVFGVLHEQCFGNYHLSLGWTHDLATYKIKKFDEYKYFYTGEKIKYLTSREYHDNFVNEYKEAHKDKMFQNMCIEEYKKNGIYKNYIEKFNMTKQDIINQIIEDGKDWKFEYNHFVSSNDEFFNDEDYKLFDKYLLL